MAASLGTKNQDPSDRLDYTINWSRLLSGDTIVTSTWDVPTGIVAVNSVFSENATSVMLSGGTAGQSYEITNRITTVGDKIIERSFTLNVTQL
jgi:hypothetical protein